jgi:hypothetical protein
MSLQALAGNLQSAGRGDDSLLVHMTPGEVHGLQSLAMAHGGSLTINPQTGLPEAGFLSSILPMIAGVGLSIASGGALTPLMTAGIVGGVRALATGSLQKGLMAGLGAYGGAGLGSSFAGASEAGLAAQEAAKNKALESAAAESAAKSAAAAPAGAVLNTTGAFNPANLNQFLQPPPALLPPTAPGAFMQNVANNAAMFTATPSAASAVAPTLSKEVLAKVAAEAAAKVPITGANLMSGASNVFNNSGALGDFAKNNMGQIGMAAAPMLAGLMEQPTLRGVPAGSPGLIRPYTYEPNYTGADKLNNQTVYNEETGLPDSSVKNYSNPVFTALTPYPAPGPEYKGGAYGATAGLTGSMAGLSPEQVESLKRTYPGLYENIGSGRTVNAADGGLMGEPVEQMTNAIGANTGYPMANLPAGAYGAYGDQDNRGIPAMMARSTGTAVDPFSGQQTLAGGGEISDLGSYSDGGRLLRGPGTGLSDNIPAQIGARQPARLANNEFVLPADVVSAVGGGSTDAGAKEFYKMMDRVRMAAHGSKKQIRPVNPAKVMPA